MAKKINIGILGATSYTGIELVRMLARHPAVAIAFVSSRSNPGERFSAIFPEAAGIFDSVLVPPGETYGAAVDCVFSCLPHAVSADLLMPFINKGTRVIDLSADFRIQDPDVYEKWYKHKHPAVHLLEKAVYGLPEINRKRIASARIVANPGCYATSVLLPLLPLYARKAASISGVIADSKSGVSGAGRTLKLSSHFVEANENFSAYSVGRSHRHTPEMEQELSAAAGRKITLTFSPHLLPVNRGILSTLYLTTTLSAEECSGTVKTAYAGEPFIRVRDAGDLPNVHGVAHTNFCDIAFTAGKDGCPVIAISTIDNLIKGASGQAVQNMNIMFDLPETDGLAR